MRPWHSVCLSFPSCKVIRLDWSLASQNHPGSFNINLRSGCPWGATGSERGAPELAARAGTQDQALRPLQPLHPPACSRPRPGRGRACLRAGSGRPGGADPAGQPHRKDSFQPAQAETGRKQTCRPRLGPSGSPAPSAAPPKSEKRRPAAGQPWGHPLPRPSGPSPPGHTWAPPRVPGL